MGNCRHSPPTSARTRRSAAPLSSGWAAIPYDPEKPTITSGVRLGTPAVTTRGFGPAEIRRVGELIVEVLDGLAAHPADNGAAERRVRAEVAALCRRFPIYAGRD